MLWRMNDAALDRAHATALTHIESLKARVEAQSFTFRCAAHGMATVRIITGV